MIQMVIFYEKSQKLSSDWGKPLDEIRLSYSNLLSATTRQCCGLEGELEKTRYFAEPALEKIILLISNLKSNKTGQVRRTKFKD